MTNPRTDKIRAQERAAKQRWRDKHREAWRKKAREKKRAARVRLYAAGLTSAGTPLSSLSPALRAMAESRRVHAPHPGGCPCYDCLFPSREYVPVVHRVVRAS